MKTFTEDKNHANTEPTQRLHSPLTIHNPALQCRGDGPQGPMPPQSKAICTPGKAYRAGSWRWARLLHGSISLPSCAQSPRAVPPFPQSLPIRSPSPHSYLSLIRLTHVHVHVTRCASSTMDVASSAWLLEQGTTCPLCCRLPHPITSPRTLHMTRSYLATGADLPMVVLLYY